MTPQINRFFHLSYLRQDVRGKPQIHELRDGDAFAELAVVLRNPNCHYGGLILNYPTPPAQVKSADLTASDLLVLTTRPPLSDDEFDSRPIKRSGTPLETTVLDAVRRTFRVCRRNYVMLSEEMAGLLPPPYRNRGEMELTLNGPACYKRYRMPYTKRKNDHQWHVEPPDSFRTVAFVLFTRIPNGPMFLNAFSMDGPGTLIWCYLLRTRFSYLLDSPRFVMAEILPQPPFPEGPPSLSFADEWPIELLLDHPLSPQTPRYSSK